MKLPDNHIIVIFGASGDLTFRKLIPALFDLYRQKLLPERFAVLGVGRSKLEEDGFRKKLKTGINAFANLSDTDADLGLFLNSIFYTSIDTSSGSDYEKLKKRLDELNTEFQTSNNILFYLATPPGLYEVIPKNLSKYNLNKEQDGGWKRIIIEKPFGHNLHSAIKLNKKLLNYFKEDQIYRIDHYLGKETVQNLLVTRFANGIFEPLWNRNYVHHVEITTAESIGVEGRGGYYDQSGALRDMIQNHLLQIASLVAMEPPTVIEATSIRNETLKVLQSVRQFNKKELRENVIRGQYTSSHVKGKEYAGYREEEGVDNNSRTETYVAMKLFIDNWRWGGVPFYLRTGKRMPTRVSEVVVHFKPTPHSLFVSNKDFCNNGNQLVIRIQPDEGMLLKFGMKIPGKGFEVKNVNMDFHYKNLQETYVPGAYERLLLDCMNGDATLYARGDAVETAWKIVQPVLDFWETPDIPLYGYPSGTWGPEMADDLFDEAGVAWRYPCRNLADDGVFCEL